MPDATDLAAIDLAAPAQRSSRRALLAAGLGSAVAFVASALGRPAAVRAGSDGDLVLGSLANSTSAVTKLTSTVNNSAALWAASDGIGGIGLQGTASQEFATGVYGVANSIGSVAVFGVSDNGQAIVGNSAADEAVHGYSSGSTGVHGITSTGSAYGVWGENHDGVGVLGQSTSSIGVSGSSSSWIGVAGSSGSNYGVYGEATGSGAGAIGVHGTSNAGVGMLGKSKAAAQPGVIGWSGGNSTGVQGISNANDANPPAPKAKTGVYGEATQDSSSRGVWGHAVAGQGVRGETSNGAALYGTASNVAGYAIRGSGRVRFDKVSGVATIPANATLVTVTPGTDVTSESFVLLTAKANIGSRSLYFSTDATNNRFTIRMSSSSASSTPVAWLLLS